MVGQAGTLWVRLSNFSWIPVAAGFRNHARINSQRHGTRQARVPAPRGQVAKCEVILAWSLSRAPGALWSRGRLEGSAGTGAILAGHCTSLTLPSTKTIFISL